MRNAEVVLLGCIALLSLSNIGYARMLAKSATKENSGNLLVYGWPKTPTKDASGCECTGYNCGCCVHLDLPKIHLDDEGCANVTYLPDQYGMSFTFSINGKIYINETISAKNPPPLCIGIPHFEKEASVCVDFYNLDVADKHFSGCIKLEAKLYHVKIQDVELGCFNIPLKMNNFLHLQKLLHGQF